MAKSKVREVLNSDDSRKEKFQYLWGYYKWHLFFILLGLLLIGYTVYEMVNRPDITFHVTVLKEEPLVSEEEAFNTELNELLELTDDPAEALGTFTPSGITSERFIAQWTAEEYDVILLDQESFDLYAEYQTMQEFEVISGVEEDALTTHEMYEYPMAIDSNVFPFFNEFETTSDLYVVIPENTQNPRLVTEFFRIQGIEIELID